MPQLVELGADVHGGRGLARLDILSRLGETLRIEVWSPSSAKDGKDLTAPARHGGGSGCLTEDQEPERWDGLA